MGKSIIKGSLTFDRNIAKVEIATHGEDRDQWKIGVYFQDAQYDGDQLLDVPRPGTDFVEATYGEIKDLELPGLGKVSDLFAPTRALGYSLLDRRDNANAAAEAANRAAQDKAKQEADVIEEAALKAAVRPKRTAP